MPMYQYKCDSCGYEFTMRMKIVERKDPEGDPCPTCLTGNVELRVGTPLVSYSTNPGMTTTSNFNDRLKEIRKTKGVGNTIETRGVS